MNSHFERLLLGASLLESVGGAPDVPARPADSHAVLLAALMADSKPNTDCITRYAAMDWQNSRFDTACGIEQ